MDFQKILAYVLLLAVMIIVHELGHFWAALAVGVRVETFSIGFGPRLFGFRRNGTDYRLSLIPLGGYVRMLGEQQGEELISDPTSLQNNANFQRAVNAVDPASFQGKARWQRAIVIMAGPLMNILLAVFILTGLFMYRFEKVDESGPTVVTEIEPGSPAEKAGVQVGDHILEFAGQRNPTWSFVTKQEMLNGNHTMDVVVQRNGQPLKLSVTPRIDAKEGIGTIGWDDLNIEVKDVEAGSPAQAAGVKSGDIFMSINGRVVSSRSTVSDVVTHSEGKPLDLQLKRSGQVIHLAVTPAKLGGSVFRIGVAYGEAFPYPVQVLKLSFPEAFVQSLRQNRDNTVFVFQTLGSILERRVSPKSVSGPIGMAKESQEAFKRGPLTYLSFMSFVSLNLAIFNLLPIPILDGGTLLLLFIEMLLQREVSMAIKETVLKLGFVLLMMVVVFVIYNDLTKS